MDPRSSMATPAESESISAPRASPKGAASPSGARWGRGALLAILLPSVTLVLLLLLWDWAVVHFQIPSTLLARPMEVASELAFGLRAGWSLRTPGSHCRKFSTASWSGPLPALRWA